MTAFIKTLAAATLVAGLAVPASAQDSVADGEFEGDTYTGTLDADVLIGNDVWEDDGTYLGRIVRVEQGADGLANRFIVLDEVGDELEIDVSSAVRTSPVPVLDANDSPIFR